jgi:hypothetical protein
MRRGRDILDPTVYTIDNVAGALVEIRIWSPVSVEEAAEWALDHDRVIESTRGEYVCFVDLTQATVFPQKVVEAYSAVMRDELRLKRTGVLLGDNVVHALQIERMLREAANPVRRAFHEVPALLEWLDAVLGPVERGRLRVLLKDRGLLPR